MDCGFCCISFCFVCVPSVLWHCWLGHLTRKNSSPIWPILCWWDVKPYSILNPYCKQNTQALLCSVTRYSKKQWCLIGHKLYRPQTISTQSISATDHIHPVHIGHRPYPPSPYQPQVWDKQHLTCHVPLLSYGLYLRLNAQRVTDVTVTTSANSARAGQFCACRIAEFWHP